MDYTPLERMQGSRRKQPNAVLEATRSLRAPRKSVVVQKPGNRSFLGQHRRQQQHLRPGLNLYTNAVPTLLARFAALRSHEMDPALHPGDTCQLPPVLTNISNIPDLPKRPPRRPSALNRKKRTLKNGNWSDEQLQAAIQAHDADMNMRQVALTSNMPYTTFGSICLVIE